MILLPLDPIIEVNARALPLDWLANIEGPSSVRLVVKPPACTASVITDAIFNPFDAAQK